MAKRKLSARQIRWLFATGKLRASGKGKDRKVTYSKEGQAPKRAAIGGSKATGLRAPAGRGLGTTEGIRSGLRNHTLGRNGTSLKNAFGLLAKEHGVPIQRIRQEAQHLAKTEQTFGTSKRGNYSSGITSAGQDVAGNVRRYRQRALRPRLEAQGATNANSKAMRNLTREERLAASAKVAQKFFNTKRGEALRSARIKAGSTEAFKAARRAQAEKRRNPK